MKPSLHVISFYRSLRSRFRRFSHQHTLLIPILVAFTFFLLIILLLLNIWFFSSVNRSLEQTIYDNAAYEADIFSDNLRFSFKDYQSISAKLNTIDSLAPRAVKNSYSAYEALKNYNFTAFKYSNLIMYYKNINKVITVLGTSDLETCFSGLTDLDSFIEHINSLEKTTLLSTRNFGAERDSVQLLYICPMSTRHFSIFSLNHHLLLPMMNLPDGNLCLLMNQAGEIMWENVEIGTQDIQKILSSILNKTNSAKLLSIGGQNYIYAMSSIGYGVNLVILTPNLGKLDVMRNAVLFFVLICLIILVMGGAALAVIIRGSYIPIHSLVKDIHAAGLTEEGASATDIGILRNICESFSKLVFENCKNEALFSTEQLSDLFILRMICGGYKDQDSIENICHYMNLDFPHASNFAVILIPDHVPVATERDKLSKQIRYNIYPNFSIYCCLSMDGSCAVGIINIDMAAGKSIRDVEPFIRSLFGDENPVTIGMGNVYQDVTMLSKSYLEARAALDYRLVKGKNSCISYSEIEQPAGGEPLYPQALLDDYVHYLHDWDTPRIAKVLDDIIRHIHSCHLPLQQVKCICVEISSAFLREASNFGIKFPWRVGRCFDVFSIAEYDSIIELTQNIQAFSSNIQSYITKQKEMRNQKLIQQCNILMEQNVSNPQFSLSQLSELTGVTSQTLRRKFKDSTGETLSNHLKDLRINRAKKLLLNTDIDLESICIQCGFFNLSSFIRLFKEETGVTPGKYRESQSSKKVISEVQA